MRLENRPTGRREIHLHGRSEMNPESEAVFTETSSAVLTRVSEGFRMLAALYEELNHSGEVQTAAQQHVTNATRELAAVQRMFERRGR